MPRKPTRPIYRQQSGRYYKISAFGMLEIDLTNEFHQGAISFKSVPLNNVIKRAEVCSKSDFNSAYLEAITRFSNMILNQETSHKSIEKWEHLQW